MTHPEVDLAPLENLSSSHYTSRRVFIANSFFAGFGAYLLSPNTDRAIDTGRCFVENEADDGRIGR